MLKSIYIPCIPRLRCFSTSLSPSFFRSFSTTSTSRKKRTPRKKKGEEEGEGEKVKEKEKRISLPRISFDYKPLNPFPLSHYDTVIGLDVNTNITGFAVMSGKGMFLSSLSLSLLLLSPFSHPRISLFFPPPFPPLLYRYPS